MLALRNVRALGGIGLIVAVACGQPLVSDLLTSIPVARVLGCRVEHVHRATLHVTLDTGETIELAQENVPSPSECLAPGTTVEKVRGEFGYRLNGTKYFWESKGNRNFAMFMVMGLLAAAWALVTILRARGAGSN